MKKIALFLFLCCLFAGYGMAQNVQLHYDFGHAIYESLEDRPNFPPPGARATPPHRFAGPWLALYLLTNLSLIIVTHAVGLPSIRVGASFISYHCARSVALAFRCRPSVS